MPDQPKSKGQTKEANDHSVMQLILSRIWLFFTVTLRAPLGGRRPAAVQAKADTLSEIIFSRDVENGLLEATGRVSGATTQQIRRGLHLQELNEKRCPHKALMTVPIAKRKDYVDPEPIYDWFHNESPDVEINKADKRRYKRKLVYCAGKWRNLQCEHRILTCSKEEAVRHFEESEFWATWLRENPGVS